MNLETSMSRSAVPPSLLDKLRCVTCGESRWRSEDRLGCIKCGVSYPLVSGRFLDFLRPSERQALEAEMKFWASHFQGVEYQDESEASYQSWLDRIQARGNEDVIELGCGSGALLRRLPGRLKVGLEPAACLLEPSHGFVGVIGSAHDLPFRDASFDLVLFKHALHHVENKKLGLAEAARILRPGGRLIVIEPNAEHPQRRLISNPHAWLRTAHVLTRFIGPVETFQPLGELVRWAEDLGLKTLQTFYSESQYDRLTVRQALQRIYSRMLRPVLSERFLLPNYFACFQKPEAHQVA